MLTAVVIDDEQDAIESLEYLLDKYCSTVSLTGSAQTVDDGVELIHTNNPDIVFLDIEIQGETGFDLLKKIPNRRFEVIFITAFSKYAIEAFKYSAVDYILKPVDRDELIEAINKVIHNIARFKNAYHDYNVLIENLNSEGPQKLAVATDVGIQYIKLESIVQIKSDDNYSTIILDNGDNIMVAKTLKQFELQLHRQKFYRIHKSSLINLNHVKMYKRVDGGKIEMSDGALIPVPRRKKEHFLNLMSSMAN